MLLKISAIAVWKKSLYLRVISGTLMVDALAIVMSGLDEAALHMAEVTSNSNQLLESASAAPATHE